MECATAGLNGSFWRTDFYILKQISHVFAIFMCRPWGVHLSVSYLFAFSYGSWGSQGKNTKVVCHSLLQETTFCQNSPLWLVHLGWPHTAWLIVSLSWTRLWSMWSVWLVFCDCDFHSVSPLMEKDRGLWKLPDGRDWLGNWILFWWAEPCSVNLESSFLLMGGAVFPSCYLPGAQIWWR